MLPVPATLSITRSPPDHLHSCFILPVHTQHEPVSQFSGLYSTFYVRPRHTPRMKKQNLPPLPVPLPCSLEGPTHDLLEYEGRFSPPVHYSGWFAGWEMFWIPRQINQVPSPQFQKNTKIASAHRDPPPAHQDCCPTSPFPPQTLRPWAIDNVADALCPNFELRRVVPVLSPARKLYYRT